MSDPTPPSPTLDQEVERLAKQVIATLLDDCPENHVRGQGVSMVNCVACDQAALALFRQFATRQREAAAQEVREQFLGSIAEAAGAERHATARRCAEIVKEQIVGGEYNKDADGVCRGIVYCFRTEFGLTEEKK